MNHSIASRFTSHVVLCLLTLNVALVPGPVAARVAQAQAAAATEARVTQTERVFDALEKAAAEIPRDTFDPEAILDLVDPEVEPLFEWVRDNTHLVPYRGALRGPVGVLMDRRGNSLDRALLLSTLLRQVGYETRLANGRLLPEAASDLMAFARPVPAGGAGNQADGSDGPALAELHRYSAEFGLDEPRLLDAGRQTAEAVERLRTEARKRTREQAKFLAEVIGPLPEGAAEGLRRRQIGALEDHWWVRVQDGRRWIDLDPSYPNAPVGWAATAAHRTVEIERLSQLGGDVLHTVRIRLILECWNGEALVEHTLLQSAPLTPAELVGRPVTLRHVPASWPSDLNLSSAADPGRRLVETVGEQDLWVPVLDIGSQAVMSQAYRDTCELSPAREALNATAQVGKALERKAGGLAGAIAGLGGVAGEGAGVVKEPGRLTAEWIEYEIRVPGEKPEVTRRQIFDLIGAATRRSGGRPGSAETETDRALWRLAVLGTTEILIVGSRLSEAYVSDLVTRRVLEQRQAILDAVRGPAGAPRDPNAGREPEMPRQDLLSLEALRHGVSGEGESVFLGSPNVFSFHQQLRTDASGNPVRLEAFDIVANRVASLPADGRQALFQGVADSNLEALLGDEACDPTSGMLPCRTYDNLADRLSTSLGADAWVLLRDEDDVRSQGSRFPPDTLARAEGETARGFWLVAPQTDAGGGTGDRGWWRFDPATGEILAIGENGWGASITEYLIVANLISGALCVYSSARSLDMIAAGLCVAGTVTGVGAYGGSMMLLSRIIRGIVGILLRVLGASLAASH